MPLRNRAERARVGRLDTLVNYASRMINETHLRLRNGELDSQSQAERTATDLRQLSRQLAASSRADNLDVDLRRSLVSASQTVSAICSLVERRTQDLARRNALAANQVGFHCGTVSAGPEGGRPRLNIQQSQLEFLLPLGFTPTSLSRENVFGNNVSRRTIYRRMNEFNIRRTEFSAITDQQLDDLVRSLNQEYPNTGYREMKQLLFQRHGITVPRQRVMESLRRVDPAGAAGRWACVVSRRTYTATSANACWHIDTNHSLIKWKIVVHGSIDGLSRVIPYLGASDNNKARTNLMYFLLGVKNFGLPSRVRADFGGENVHIERYMNETCGVGRGSFIKGRSVHNSRIERLWRDVFVKVCSKYYNLFSALEDSDLLDCDNDDHIYILHRVYLPRINRDLQEWANVHNQSPLSSCNNQSPLRLWISDLLRQQGAPGTALRNFWSRDVDAAGLSVLEEFGLDGWDLSDPENHEPHVIVKQLEVSFTEAQAENMTQNVDVLRDHS